MTSPSCFCFHWLHALINGDRQAKWPFNFVEMKWRAFILVVMVLFFTVQPILICCQLASKAVEETACCNMDEKPSCPINESKGCKQEDSPCNSGSNTSNPFASCSQCAYLNSSKFNCAGIPMNDITHPFIRFNEKIAAGFMANCWQPPETV